MGFMFAARNVGLATVIAITLLNKVEYAVFAVVYGAINWNNLVNYAASVSTRTNAGGAPGV